MASPHLLLLLALQKTAPNRADRSSGNRIDFDHLPMNETLMFRFTTNQLRQLATLLKIPESVSVNRNLTSGEELLALLCRRLAYPNRLCELKPLFGRSESALSAMFLHTVDMIWGQWGHLINTDVERFHKLKSKMPMLAQAVSDAGSALPNVFGFVDGTKLDICRPTEHQEAVYDGHHRVHDLGFHHIVLPNGIIFATYGPVEGSLPDSVMWAKSRMQSILDEVCPNGEFCIFGDKGYSFLLSRQLQTPFTADHCDYNYLMARVRESVEWANGLIMRQWAFLDYSKDIKVLLSPVGKEYLVAVLLTNMLTCMNGHNQISDFFKLKPPTIEEYLSTY
jgi:hypothetical protein